MFVRLQPQIKKSRSSFKADLDESETRKQVHQIDKRTSEVFQLRSSRANSRSRRSKNSSRNRRSKRSRLQSIPRWRATSTKAGFRIHAQVHEDPAVLQNKITQIYINPKLRLISVHHPNQPKPPLYAPPARPAHEKTSRRRPTHILEDPDLHTDSKQTCHRSSLAQRSS